MTKRLTEAEKSRRCAARSMSAAFDCLNYASYSDQRVQAGFNEQAIADLWYETALIYMMYALVQDPAYYDQFLFPWELPCKHEVVSDGRCDRCGGIA